MAHIVLIIRRWLFGRQHHMHHHSDRIALLHQGNHLFIWNGIHWNWLPIEMFIPYLTATRWEKTNQTGFRAHHNATWILRKRSSNGIHLFTELFHLFIRWVSATTKKLCISLSQILAQFVKLPFSNLMR